MAAAVESAATAATATAASASAMRATSLTLARGEGRVNVENGAVIGWMDDVWRRVEGARRCVVR